MPLEVNQPDEGSGGLAESRDPVRPVDAQRDEGHSLQFGELGAQIGVSEPPRVVAGYVRLGAMGCTGTGAVPHASKKAPHASKEGRQIDVLGDD
jgi:hypothetical protein